jgi:hypothetical protein
LLERDPQFIISRLHFFEEPGVLDRDHCLVGKRLQQCNLLFGKRPHFHAPDQDRSDRLPLPQQRSGKRRSMPVVLGECRSFRKVALGPPADQERAR